MMEPPYAGRHVRWCERSHGELIPMLLLDFIDLSIVMIHSVNAPEGSVLLRWQPDSLCQLR